jgi:serine/threonine protein kinase
MNELINGSELQDGKYRIEKKIGSGGFGITYKGRTNVIVTGELGKMDVSVDVAIKEFFMNERCVRGNDGQTVTVPSSGSHQQVEKYKKKFVCEAQKLSSIKHPHIVSVTDVFEEHNTVYYVMRYLPGGSLAELVKKSPVRRLSENEAKKYINEIGGALSYLHSRHICHFDVKPQNVLLDDKGNAVLIDFGISKTFDNVDGVNSTSVNYTNHYAPIEQYTAMTDFSPQTDLYSLGATLYYLLTGEVPAEASSLYEEGFPKQPYYVSSQIWEAVKLAMKPTRKERPESISKWLDILNSCMEEGDGLMGTDGYDGYDGETVVSHETSNQKFQNSERENDSSQSVASIHNDPGTGSQTGATTSSTTSTTGISTYDTIVKQKPITQWIIIALIGIIAAGIGAGAYFFFNSQGGKAATPLVEKMTTIEALKMLGSIDVSYEEVLYLANNDSLIIHIGTKEEEENLKELQNTVAQIYMEFMNVPHDLNRLVNAYSIKAEYLSQEQVAIMIWFFNKSKAERERWNESTRQIHSFKEFKEEMMSILGE